MTASTNNDTVGGTTPFFDNRKEDSRSERPKQIDEFTFESAESICRRFDISESTFFKIVAKHRVKKHRFPEVSSVRYRTMDLVRLIAADMAANQ